MGYVYRHIRLDKNEPFYIGIGSDNSYTRANTKHERNNIWHKIVSKTDYLVEIVFEHNDYEVIKEKEIELILLYGRINLSTGSLSNLTNGGDGMLGFIPSEESRKNQSIRMSGENNPGFGKRYASVTKGMKKPKMVGLLSGEKNPMYNKNHTAKSREKISNALLGKYVGKDNPMWGKVRPEVSLNNKLSKGKKVLDTVTGDIYNCTRDASDFYGIGYSTLKQKLTGYIFNNTNLVRYDG
ncbi:NUMOD3 domain-containing DNA-binding protein [Flavobacterium sp. FlaQc-50]|uniref:NUMOD3 domain-containing DNA-binding protein n=1 Tax=unclassified Flavobacterium TaxID=196869 RepID=UPI003756370C